MAKKELDTRQMEACNLWLARKENKMTLEAIATQVGVSRRTLYEWTKLDAWKEYAKEATISVAKEHLPQVMSNLIRLATTSSSSKPIELFLRVVGVLGADTMKVEVNNTEQDRSMEAIEADIERLRRQLEEADNIVEFPVTKKLTDKERQELEIEYWKRQLADMDE
jgi:AcrR family transcriptional regulator